ncbi:hypothetical protein PF001_g27721, partial [Phytophthora fragariae]
MSRVEMVFTVSLGLTTAPVRTLLAIRCSRRCVAKRRGPVSKWWVTDSLWCCRAQRLTMWGCRSGRDGGTRPPILQNTDLGARGSQGGKAL